jgi:hypothetical protein
MLAWGRWLFLLVLVTFKGQQPCASKSPGECAECHGLGIKSQTWHHCLHLFVLLIDVSSQPTTAFILFSVKSVPYLMLCVYTTSYTCQVLPSNWDCAELHDIREFLKARVKDGSFKPDPHIPL